MSYLFSVDKPLNKEIINSLKAYSTRLLTGGLSLSTSTINKWLRRLDEIPTDSICIGTSQTENFQYLQCSKELSQEGVLNI